MGWLINIALLNDRFIIILFKLLKFGLIKTKQSNMNGISIVFGVWKFELQVNLSKLHNQKITLKDYGRA